MMQSPYELRHFTEIGGSIVDTFEIVPFIVLAPTHGTALLEPTTSARTYLAERHRVQKTIAINGWDVARSWGRGGDGTVGWSGTQPLDAQQNAASSQYQTGYCRFIGDGAPNPNNIRDISWRSDSITLETFVYNVLRDDNDGWDKPRWFPAHPDSVVFRYSVWGRKTVTGVEAVQSNDDAATPRINAQCESRRFSGHSRALVHYDMNSPGPVSVAIYDLMGNLHATEVRDVWSSEKQMISVGMEDAPNGIYVAVVRSRNAVGYGKFTLTK